MQGEGYRVNGEECRVNGHLFPPRSRIGITHRENLGLRVWGVEFPGGGTTGFPLRPELKGTQCKMAQGRSTESISTIKWIRASRLSIKNSLSKMETSSFTTQVDVSAMPTKMSQLIVIRGKVLGTQICGYLEMGIQTPMARGRSTKSSR